MVSFSFLPGTITVQHTVEGVHLGQDGTNPNKFRVAPLAGPLVASSSFHFKFKKRISVGQRFPFYPQHVRLRPCKSFHPLERLAWNQLQMMWFSAVRIIFIAFPDSSYAQLSILPVLAFVPHQAVTVFLQWFICSWSFSPNFPLMKSSTCRIVGINKYWYRPSSGLPSSNEEEWSVCSFVP